MLMCISEIKKPGTLFLSTNFVENMFSLKRSQNINISLLAKHFLKTKLKIIPFQISNIEWNLYLVKRFLPFVRLYFSWALQSRGILGIFKIASLLYHPLSVFKVAVSHP